MSSAGVRRGPERVDAVLLAPGAGGSRDHGTLLAVEEVLAPLPVTRMDFPARKAGKRGVDRPAVAVAAVREEAEVLAGSLGTTTARIVIGGRSFGGRMCSMAVAEGLDVAGLVLLSYPLHPPGRPESLRVEHFGDLAVPCLFVSGDRDPFATPDELAVHVRAIRGPVTLVTVPGAHDPKGQHAAVAEAVARWLAVGSD